MSGIIFGNGITLGAGIGVGGAGSGGPPDPATNTGGISLAVISGLPQTLTLLSAYTMELIMLSL